MLIAFNSNPERLITNYITNTAQSHILNLYMYNQKCPNTFSIVNPKKDKGVSYVYSKMMKIHNSLVLTGGKLSKKIALLLRKTIMF